MDTHRSSTLAQRVAARRLSRRTALRGLAGGGLALAGAAQLHAPAMVGAATPPPNILVVLVDEMREPQWFPGQATLDTQLPALARLRQGAVHFTQHYTACNMCSPSRGVLTTGLYSHQNGQRGDRPERARTPPAVADGGKESARGQGREPARRLP